MRSLFGLFGALVCALVVGWIAGEAFAIPTGRHYEMVSPVFKGGFGATKIEAVALDGQSVAYFSPGSFAGAPGGVAVFGYVAHRGASDWTTVPTMAPAELMPETKAYDVSPSLDTVFRMGNPGPNTENTLNEVYMLLHLTDLPDVSDWEVAGVLKPLIPKLLQPVYRSSDVDFCDVLLSSTDSGPLVSEGSKAEAQELYDFERGCSGSQPSVALVGLNNKGKLIHTKCDTMLGDALYGPGQFNMYNAVSADGSEVFFTVCLNTSGELEFGASLPHQVFVRLGGSRTVEVSKPLTPVCQAGGVVGEVPCEGALERGSADFAGASADGSRVYFTAPLAAGQPPLVPGDADSSRNLYMATIGCPQATPECTASEREVTSLTEVSHDPSAGQAANVMGVVRVAPDGTRAYFVASGDLLSVAQREALQAEGRPLPQLGAANLYVYDAAAGGSLAFVADLCSGQQLSGAFEDIRCPSSTGTDERLWTNDEVEAQTAGADGRFLVFATYAQLTSADTNVAKDVYRYDAVTGALERVSGGEDGFDANGNRKVLDEKGEALGASIRHGHFGGALSEQYEMDNRAISEDGSRIVFTSAEPLSPAASNGLENPYEWHEGTGGGEGSVALVSSGGSSEPITEVTISPDGSGVFFDTVEGLAAQDTDGAPDIYDARLGDGFTRPPAPRRPCEGDACQGPLTNPAALLIPGSVSQESGENVPPSKPKKKAKAKKKRKAGRRRGKAGKHLNRPAGHKVAGRGRR